MNGWSAIIPRLVCGFGPGNPSPLIGADFVDPEIIKNPVWRTDGIQSFSTEEPEISTGIGPANSFLASTGQIGGRREFLARHSFRSRRLFGCPTRRPSCRPCTPRGRSGILRWSFHQSRSRRRARSFRHYPSRKRRLHERRGQAYPQLPCKCPSGWLSWIRLPKSIRLEWKCRVRR